MTKILILFRKRSDIGMDEFQGYWREVHGPIAAKLPGLRRYVQDHVLVDPAQDDRPYDAVAELWFDNVELFQAALASPVGQTTLADAERFADMDSVRILMAEEVAIV